MQTIRTGFKPEQHGFKFSNSFEFPDFLQIRLPFGPIPALPIGQLVYGLCGGMSFAALDYYHAGKSIPTFAEADEISLRLFFYLWERQLASLDHGVVQNVFKWMLFDDITSAKTMSQWEIPKLRDRLNEGEPAVLALIRAKPIDDPTKNHQVVACGYDFDPDTKQMTIYLYDPNHPGEQPSLSLGLAKPEQGIGLAQSTQEPLRSFFLINYEVKVPL